MRNRFRILLIMFAVLTIFGIKASTAAAGGGGQYCATPPFVQANLPSNIMLVLDYSGSMSWHAYTHDSSYDSNKSYYGYFVSGKLYNYSYYGYYYIPSNPGRYSYSGNYLNWKYMTRIDILRWILTGGRINGSNNVESSDGYTAIKKEDASSYDPTTQTIRGILQKIAAQSQKPRIGASFFAGGSGSGSGMGGMGGMGGGGGGSSYVFDRVGLSYDYATLINEINTKSPGGSTGTYAAVNEMKELYSNNPTNLATIKEYGYPYKYNGATVSCVKNFVLLMSDGEWNEPNQSTDSDPIRPIDDMWKGGKADLVNNSSLSGDQNVETYTVSMFSDPTDSGTNALKWMAVYGNYNDKDNNGKPYNLGNNSSITLTSGYPDTSLTQTENLETLLNNPEVKSNAGGTGPYGYFEGKDANELKTSITTAFNEILKQVSSGSAASVVSTNGKSGANIVKALFFPKKTFSSGAEVSWTGDLKNFWYYLGPFAQNIREDNDTLDYISGDTSGPMLDLAKDWIMEFDSSDPTKVNLFADINGNGTKDTFEGQVSIDNTVPIWDAGYQLFKQSYTSSSRTIFTTLDPYSSVGDSYTSTDFSDVNSSSLMTYLDTSSATSAAALINYIRGDDISGFRSRTVTMDGQTGVYKLGDIIYSTPKIVSSIPAGSYYKDYNDQTYKDFIDSAAYRNRMGIVVVGANDGMLHAFKFGRPTVLYGQGSKIFTLNRYESDGTLGKPLGAELWAYIPENILPYLKYYADPNYCHLYYVDLTPTVVDASIYDSSSASYNNVADDTKTQHSWRTIVIGGLRFGGACGDSNSSSPAIHPPALDSPATGVGRSSYFAIDVTDTEHPKLLWEFTDNNLAFSTAGPAVIHIPAKYASGTPNAGKDDNSLNGNWYVVFGSGPDKYDGTVHQPLYLYALDLGTGKLERKWQLSGSGGSPLSSITNAFAGRLTNGVIDLGENYSDDALYFGYNYNKGTASTPDWDGGILRLITDDKTPTNWRISKLIDGIGPITASTSVLEDKSNKKLWIFAGSGRYFTATDDSTAQRNLYGVIDQCYNGSGYNSSCSPISGTGSLTDVTSDPAAANATNGWYINLDPSTSSANAERLISDPVVSLNGTVFFATTAPTSDICSYGGNSYVWELNYSNGGALSSSELSSFLIQTSTGAITKINASEFVGSGSRGGRRSKKIKGIDSPGGPTVIVAPSPINRFLHWYER